MLLVPLTVNDLPARNPVDYLRDEFDNETGRLSLDGRFIAYRSDEAKPERFEVYVRPFDAAKPVDEKKWQVSKNGVPRMSNEAVVSMLYWRDDGMEILFRGQELDSDDVVMMAAEVETFNVPGWCAQSAVQGPRPRRRQPRRGQPRRATVCACH